MQIAVVGGGPGGAWASILLAKRGHTVTLIDSQMPWEKPCGGGVTTKALTRFGVFDADLPRKDVQKITLFFGDQAAVSILPPSALTVVSRRELGQRLLDEAVSSNVRVITDRVTKIQSTVGGWLIIARNQEIRADFLVGADGARSLVRKELANPLPPEDLCFTLGYFIPGNVEAEMKVFFVPTLEGYIWSFARPSHVSYGLISRSGPGKTARAKELLWNFIVADMGAEVMEHAEFYSAPVPCLGPGSWKNNVIAGNGWALVGDAAGLADPITGEGIYFAFRSAEILAETFEGRGRYADAVWEEIGRELARASRFYRKFYHGRFLGGDFRKRTIQLAGRSRTLRQILGNLVTGNLSYVHLKKKLVFSAPSVGWDFITRRK